MLGKEVMDVKLAPLQEFLEYEDTYTTKSILG